MPNKSRKRKPAKKAPPRSGRAKWRVVEGVVAAFEEATKIEGAKVVRNAAVPYRNNPDRSRQVDVYVETPAGPRTLTVGIEVKNERRALTVEVVEQVHEKLSKLALDRRCIVSTSGFTATAVKDAEASGIDLIRVDEHGRDVAVALVARWVDPVHIVPQFSERDLIRVRDLVPDPPDSRGITIVQNDGKRFPINLLVRHHGIESLTRPEMQHLKHGDVVEVQMIQNPPWCAIELETHPHLSLPVPLAILCKLRVHVEHHKFDAHAFMIYGQEAVSTIASLDNNLIQITMLRRIDEQGGSSQRVVFSSIPTRPTPVGPKIPK